jgi:transposase
MQITLGIDVACRAAHQASCADATGRYVWSGHRFSTTCMELDRLWKRLPADAEQVTVVMEPTRNAWVPLAAWFRRHGAKVVLVPTEQSADLRAYYSKHTKNDRLDSKILARLPLLHPEGFRACRSGPGGALAAGGATALQLRQTAYRDLPAARCTTGIARLGLARRTRY